MLVATHLTAKYRSLQSHSAHPYTETSTLAATTFPAVPSVIFSSFEYYHVIYKCRSVLGPLPTVMQVEKGTAYHATTCLDKDLLLEHLPA